MDGQQKESEAASFVAEKLTAWNLANYIDVFKDNEVDADAFLIIGPEQVAELIPLVGPRSKFLAKRSEYLNENNLNLPKELFDDLNDTFNPTSLGETPITTHRNLYSDSANERSGERLKRLLKIGVRSNALLKKESLTHRDRGILCGAIVDHLLSMEKNPAAADFKFWAQQVTAVFPYELLGSWYEPYKGGPNKRLASGKLWDKYNNEKKYIGLKKSANKSGQKTTPDETLMTEEVTAALVKLRVISPDDAELKNLWRLTARVRDKTIAISEYYKQYPVLSTKIGHSLIEIDFDASSLVTDPSILIKTWADTAKKILVLAKKRRICKDIFLRREQASVETLGFIILPYLFRTSKVKTNNRKLWRPTQSEVSDAFILQITSMGDYLTKIAERRDKLSKYALTVQPFVLTVGTLTSYEAVYVVVEDTKYEFSSLMGAVDFCFKATWALNAKYQTECETVWYFIQKFIYKIDADILCDKTYQSALTVWSDIQSLQYSDQ